MNSCFRYQPVHVMLILRMGVFDGILLSAGLYMA